MSTVSESIFENRFRYVDELRRMGAKIQVDGKTATIESVSDFTARRCRPATAGGCGAYRTALAANGITEIENVEHIERGYENIVEKLRGWVRTRCEHRSTVPVERTRRRFVCR